MDREALLSGGGARLVLGVFFFETKHPSFALGVWSCSGGQARLVLGFVLFT